jgi:hypothetical protein
MLFELLGFLSGTAAIGAAFWLLYQRDSSRGRRGCLRREARAPARLNCLDLAPALIYAASQSLG